MAVSRTFIAACVLTTAAACVTASKTVRDARYSESLEEASRTGYLGCAAAGYSSWRCGETRSIATKAKRGQRGMRSARRDVWATHPTRTLPGHLPNASTPPRRFVAPQGAVARSAPLLAEKAASSVSVAQVGQAAAATTLLAALPANAFSAAYLPAILVPVMCLVMPVLGMGLFTILTQKEEL